ncbi:MAG: IS256 family transposase, partial [bacterium]|nr:IS256 family transposase [bacterium]
KKKNRSKAPSPDTQQSLQLAGVMRRTLLAFVIQQGMRAFDLMLEQERTELCGPAHAKGDRDDPVRWGHTDGRLVMGGQRVLVRKPRVRHNGKEVTLPTWAEFADHDPLDARTMEQMVLGVSTRNYDRSLDSLPDELGAHGTSKSAASRRFVGRTKAQLDAWLKRDISELSIAAIMLDALNINEHTVLVALGIDAGGRKHPLGLWVGATENSTVCGELLDNLVERGLDAQRRYLFVIDGSKALRKAIRDRFGRRALVQRCQEHKRRNVLGHLPKSMQRTISKTMRDAYKSRSKKTARRRLLQLVSLLDEEHPDAAASLREGLDETLTLKDLALCQSLERTLSTTNPIENLNGAIRRITRNVKRWRNQHMVRRWVAASVLEASKGFRRLRGYKSMPKLTAALRSDAEQNDRIDAQETAA